MVDPYTLYVPDLSTSLSSTFASAQPFHINNIVFMDDSTLIASSKTELEYMLSITEEFYCLNNTITNHNNKEFA
ncbi:hypothetical protein RIR_jg21147.t1 [Rhizophagus irregularis DAOM 181602=DAOM 197198]|uniref:Reverse transcriptase domain-containing protein n=1 Tax=Rhizophagus irregularis (strain DAOM 197198w) TaxID=1432141 RepID=A0A015K382_RHIIW|nr:hypothetical protein RirG_239750 [Rhizophagus irregularis DAOM 197198w]GBC42652.1 hypothetical protein RIR_jg21147.t1 [Rhizophagus irregularis DAOM 181602=DAOM 197198]